MLFSYQISNKEGQIEDGSIDAPTVDIAINSLQRRGFTIVAINEVEAKVSLFSRSFTLFARVPQRDVVILSRQLATLFEAKVAVLNIFKLLAVETEHPTLRGKLVQITDDIQTGVPISTALAKHSDVFSSFYINMVKAGEETGKLSETFNFLADYLERSYELVAKARNALIYPAFVIVSFTVVMVLMMVVVIPKLSIILKESGQELPFFTQLIIGLSDFLVTTGPYLLVLLLAISVVIWRYAKTSLGTIAFARLQLTVPYVGTLYRKLYLSRIADNMDTMLSSGISMLRALEITADVVGSKIYENVLRDAIESVKGGSALSEAFDRHSEIPQIMVQMSRIGEETGKLGYVLKTISRFYKREVDTAIDTIVSLIEPFMIVSLGLGVGILLVAVLGPIYNITGTF